MTPRRMDVRHEHRSGTNAHRESLTYLAPFDSAVRWLLKESHVEHADDLTGSFDKRPSMKRNAVTRRTHATEVYEQEEAG
jgi:hypothetical protein